MEELVENAALHDVLPPVDVFRAWKVYLVECEGQARLLSKGPQPGVQEAMLRDDEFDAAPRATHTQLDAFYEREAPIGGR